MLGLRKKKKSAPDSGTSGPRYVNDDYIIFTLGNEIRRNGENLAKEKRRVNARAHVAQLPKIRTLLLDARDAIDGRTGRMRDDSTHQNRPATALGTFASCRVRVVAARSRVVRRPPGRRADCRAPAPRCARAHARFLQNRVVLHTTTQT
ncbi:hypothetical protein EVAR_49594_1 [Eumeta japonica]|uniref:Uncharacterized protein n=1 Tax=Eumeta variegata TaxID=151549 RepID=A0A4C1ZWB0_EUMVA|nr:hypothetical protein EVAR_49594_1 [Eumeta japonica]